MDLEVRCLWKTFEYLMKTLMLNTDYVPNLRKALIYVVPGVEMPGKIRDEYAARMRLAIADAQVLGISKSYLRTELYPFIESA